mgnify:CR=1 FL=1
MEDRKIRTGRKLNKFFIALGALILLPTFILLIVKLEMEEVLKVENVDLHAVSDIINFNDSLIVPIVYENIEVLDSLEGDSLRHKFIEVLLPSVLIAKYRIEEKRKRLIQIRKKVKWHKRDSSYYLLLKEDYKAGDLDDLIYKMQTHPNSIVLAQAAIESGWGRSRFCKEANNLFGVWSFNKNEPRIRASSQRGDKAIYLKKYETLSHSIEDYFKILARANAYKSFRTSRVESTDPFEMVNHLIYYSEKRWGYVRLLKIIMRKSDLTQYDAFKIDPQYFVKRVTIN